MSVRHATLAWVSEALQYYNIQLFGQKFANLFEPSSRQNTEYPVTSDDPVLYGGCHDNVTNLFDTIAAVSLVGGVGGSGLVGVAYPV